MLWLEEEDIGSRYRNKSLVAKFDGKFPKAEKETEEKGRGIIKKKKGKIEGRKEGRKKIEKG